MAGCLTYCLFGYRAFRILGSARFGLRVALARRGHRVDGGKLPGLIRGVLALRVQSALP